MVGNEIHNQSGFEARQAGQTQERGNTFKTYTPLLMCVMLILNYVRSSSASADQSVARGVATARVASSPIIDNAIYLLALILIFALVWIKPLPIRKSGVLLGFYVYVIVWSFAWGTPAVSLDSLPLYIVVACVYCWGVTLQRKHIFLLSWAFLADNVFAIFTKAHFASAPYNVYEPGSSIIGIPVRMYGASSHPNALGFVAGVCLFVIVALKPKRFEVLLVVGLTILFVMAQSKSSWGSMAIAVTIYRFRWKPPSLTMVAYVALPVLYCLALKVSEVAGLLPSFTGRTAIWQILIERSSDSPLYGGGPNAVFEALQVTSLFNTSGSNAHNGVLAVLVNQGIIGLGALTIFLIGSLKFVSRNPVSLSLFIYVLVRGMFEGTWPGHSDWIWAVAFAAVPPVMVAERLAAKSKAAHLLPWLNQRRTLETSSPSGGTR